MYRAIDAAYYLLKSAKSKDVTITNLKLQKLIYIANGYMLALHDRPLIDEQPQAWKYGPVIHSIYRQFKSYEDRPIEIDASPLENTALSPEAQEVIDDVIDTYGSETAIDLVNLTHEADTPWDEVWNRQGGHKQLFAEIGNDLIKNHFLKAVTAPQSVNGL